MNHRIMPSAVSQDVNDETNPPRVNRRSWLRRAGRVALGGAATAAGTVAYTLWVEPHWLEILERDLPVAGLPPYWQGKRLLQISDIHVGYQVSDDYLIQSFRRVAELSPDVVLVTGDFVSHRSRRNPVPDEQLHAVYQHLPQGTVATLGILGNHDYGPSWSDLRAADRLCRVVEQHGLQMLRNETADLDGLEIVGLDEYWSSRWNLPAALASSSPDVPRIALCHNPDGVDHAGWKNFQGWILAGHTHGGQCKPPFLSPPRLPVKNRRYTAGEFDLFDGRRLYINRGLGHLLQARFNVRPEITMFRLVAS
jgi:predicted MPP superfamily phosphohydrolase